MKLIYKIIKKANKLFVSVLHAKMQYKIAIIIVVFILCYGGTMLYKKSKPKKAEYQTTKVVKGTLTTTITGSGTISSGNSTNITTASTGTIKTVFVINGDVLTKGDKIAELTLDEYGLQQQSYYYAKYIDALHAVKVAQQAKDENDIAMWEARQDILDAEEAIRVKDLDPINPTTKKAWTLSERTVVDKNLDKARKAYEAAEFQYKNSDTNIIKAKNDVTAAWKNYEEVSSIIYAPASGTVNNLALSPGVVISNSSNTRTTNITSSTSTTITSQTLGKIYDLDGQLQATVHLTESDVTKISPNQKAVITLDAYSDKTFTGKVLAVDTSGNVNSGVTTYPVTILLDKTSISIYPNMAASASIITSVKTDVILIPSAAITAENDASFVQILENNKPKTLVITTGSSNETQTEILSGLSEGMVVITNIVSENAASENNTTSQFGTTRRSDSTNRNNRELRIGGMGGPGF